MQIEINDDFDLAKIVASGQCFRAGLVDNGTYRFITGNNVLYIQEAESGLFSVSCDCDEWNSVWVKYFDLDRNYRTIFEEEHGKHPFVDRTMDAGRGLRILRQDPWEILVSTIISQRKSIPAIQKSVEIIAEKYGIIKKTEYEELKLFPSAKDLLQVSEDDMRKCGVGYRAPYILDAISKVASGEVDLGVIKELPDGELLQSLERIRGVGGKVANCVALFSYGRTACVPVDVWISRAINDDCCGISPFDLYGENAGIIQQYIFYYKLSRQR